MLLFNVFAVSCGKPPEMGPCENCEQRYGFIPATGRCETFIYGGCPGNNKNFVNIDESERACA